MSRTEQDVIRFIQTVVQDHDKYWERERPKMKKYKALYQVKFWEDQDIDETMIRVETADGYAYIESFIAALFSRAPAVEIGRDEALAGDPEIAQSTANRFLYDQVETLENASRLALIFNNSFFKLAPRQSSNVLDRVALRAVPCWEVIVDKDASRWEDQRYVGHTYFITVKEAKERFGAKKFTGIEKEDYFAIMRQGGRANRDKVTLPDDYLYIKVAEVYDLMHDKLYFWSSQYAGGQKLLEKSGIPVRSYDDNPMAPIAPLYYARVPDIPLEGMSSMARVYDAMYEKNILRTYMANAVRRDSRQYLYREDVFDQEQLAQITAGVDGAMIGVDAESLGGLLIEVPTTPVSSNHERYLNAIEADINRGSILAPFSRGEATKATATEITALAQYSASEVGKLARDRDLAIEYVARLYLRVLALMIEEGEKAVVEVNDRAKVVTLEHLDSKWKVSALDQGSQPLSDALRKRNLVELLPILTQLGVQPDDILEEIVRAYDLPKSFLEKAPKEEVKVGPGSVPDNLQTQAQPTPTGPQNLANALMSGAQTQGLE